MRVWHSMAGLTVIAATCAILLVLLGYVPKAAIQALGTVMMAIITAVVRWDERRQFPRR